MTTEIFLFFSTRKMKEVQFILLRAVCTCLIGCFVAFFVCFLRSFVSSPHLINLDETIYFMNTNI